MKTKQIAVLACVIVLAAFALGAAGVVNLVNPGAGEGEKGRLVGLFISREPLDLFDSELYFSENIEKALSGGEISRSEVEKYGGRLFAERTEEKRRDEETGEEIAIAAYSFGAVKGIKVLAPTENSPLGAYRTTDYDPAFTEADISIDARDEGEDVRVKGKIYVAQEDMGDKVYYFNPVYQLSSGEVFAVGGNSMSFGDMGAGSSCGMTISERQTSTWEGKETSYGFEIGVSLCAMETPGRIFVAQFDGSDRLLEKAEYAPGTLPESMRPLSDTQYIIVETASAVPGREEAVSRALYQRTDDTLTAFYPKDDVCIPQACEILWPGR